MQKQQPEKGKAPVGGTTEALSEANPYQKESNVNDSKAVQVSVQPVFSFGTHNVRLVIRDGEPWFVASDVCAALDYKNTSKAVADHLDDDERMTLTAGYGQSVDAGNGLTTGYTPAAKRGGARFTVVINESGLYALVLRSRKPEARKFAKWVTSEVLPAIRKTGVYVGKPFTVNPGDVLTAEEQNTLRLMLKSAVEKLPKEKQAGAMIKGWSKLKAHFGVAYRAIPRQEFSEAVSIIARHTAEWELVEDSPSAAKESYHFPLESADPHDRWCGNAWLTPRVLTDPANRAVELELIEQLEVNGHDVMGAKVRILAMRQNMDQCQEAKEALRKIRERLGPLIEMCAVALAERGKNVMFGVKPNPNDPIDRHVYGDQMVRKARVSS